MPVSVRIRSTPVDITTPESTDPRAEYLSKPAYLTAFSQLHGSPRGTLIFRPRVHALPVLPRRVVTNEPTSRQILEARSRRGRKRSAMCVDSWKLASKAAPGSGREERGSLAKAIAEQQERARSLRTALNHVHG